MKGTADVRSTDQKELKSCRADSSSCWPNGLTVHGRRFLRTLSATGLFVAKTIVSMDYALKGAVVIVKGCLQPEAVIISRGVRRCINTRHANRNNEVKRREWSVGVFMIAARGDHEESGLPSTVRCSFPRPANCAIGSKVLARRTFGALAGVSRATQPHRDVDPVVSRDVATAGVIEDSMGWDYL